MSDEQAPAPIIEVVSGNPTDDELAAVTAVLSVAAAEAAAERDARRAPTGQSAWQQSQRPLRQPLRIGPGQWGRHAG